MTSSTSARASLRREDSSMVESFTAVRTQLCKLHVTLYCD